MEDKERLANRIAAHAKAVEMDKAFELELSNQDYQHIDGSEKSVETIAHESKDKTIAFRIFERAVGKLTETLVTLLKAQVGKIDTCVKASIVLNLDLEPFEATEYFKFRVKLLNKGLDGVKFYLKSDKEGNLRLVLKGNFDVGL